MFLLAETVFQSMDGSLSFIGLLLLGLFIVVFGVGLSLEVTLFQLVRYARAILEEIRGLRAEVGKAKPPALPPENTDRTNKSERTDSATAASSRREPDVYRI